MQWYEVVYVIVAYALGLFLTIGGYILGRDRYWQRVWEALGKPDVKSIKELKALSGSRGTRLSAPLEKERELKVSTLEPIKGEGNWGHDS